MQIFPISKEQLYIVKDLAYRIWPSAYASILSEAQLEYMLSNFYSLDSLEKQIDNGLVFLVVDSDGTFIGFASYELHHSGTTKTKLHKLYVLPATQGTGLGKKLLEEVAEKAIAAKDTHLFLNVNKYNIAKNFYEKQHFKVIQEEVIPIGNDYIMDDYVMEKEI